MPAPLSNDLRKRIISAKLKGYTEDRISIDKDVHKSTVTKLWSLYRETNDYTPRPNPCGRKPYLSHQQMELMRHTIECEPDITLSELKESLVLPVCISA
jgi:transposase